MQTSSAADGERAPASPSLNASATEDTAMQQDSREGEYSESSSDCKASWIDVVTKAQRRRQRKVDSGSGSAAVSPATQALPLMRKTTPRPNPLPRDDFKLVLRPQDGLKLGSVENAEISLSLLNAINFTWRQAYIRVRLDTTQNIATISTPSAEAAKALSHITQIKIGNSTHVVTLYGLAPDDSAKGIIRGVPVRFTEAEILANIDQTQFEVYACRRLGQSSIIVLTFAGTRVPYYVTLYGAEYPCTLYKKTFPVCTQCHESGHRATACPQPSVSVCHQCGLRDPQLGHTCEPKCNLCGGSHLTAAKGCPKRFKEPYLLRKRELEKRRAEERASRKDLHEQRGRPRDRSTTPERRRRGSSSGSQSRSTSRNRATGPSATNKQVSWADVASPTSLPSPESFRLDQNKASHTGCQECAQLRSQLEQQRAQIAEQHTLIATLQARLEAIEQAQSANAIEKRKRPNRQDKQHDASMDTSLPPPPNTETPRPTSNPTATETSRTQCDEQTTQPPWFQTAMINFAKSLTDGMDAQFNALGQDIQTIKQGLNNVGQEVQNHVARIEWLEAGFARAERVDSTNTRANKRPTPYTRDPRPEYKDITGSHDATTKQ